MEIKVASVVMKHGADCRKELYAVHLLMSFRNSSESILVEGLWSLPFQHIPRMAWQARTGQFCIQFHNVSPVVLGGAL